MTSSISCVDPHAGKLETTADERVDLRKRTMPRWDTTPEVCVGQQRINMFCHDIRGSYHEFYDYKMPI